MPYLFLIASETDSAVLYKHIKTIGARLRFNTTVALPDLNGETNKVSVLILTHKGGDNVAPLIILGLANYTDKRESELGGWTNILGAAWSQLLGEKKLSELKDIFPMEKVEIYPFLATGSFAIASLAAKMFLASEEWR